MPYDFPLPIVNIFSLPKTSKSPPLFAKETMSVDDTG